MKQGWFTRWSLPGRLLRVLPQYISKEGVAEWFGLTKQQWDERVTTLEKMGLAKRGEGKSGKTIDMDVTRDVIINRLIVTLNYEKGVNRPCLITVILMWYPGQEPLPHFFDYSRVLDKVWKELAPEFQVEMKTWRPDGKGLVLLFSIVDKRPGRSWDANTYVNDPPGGNIHKRPIQRWQTTQTRTDSTPKATHHQRTDSTPEATHHQELHQQRVQHWCPDIQGVWSPK